jgi:hypothetical protein
LDQQEDVNFLKAMKDAIQELVDQYGSL